jgi:hypothetical protein
MTGTTEATKMMVTPKSLMKTRPKRREDKLRSKRSILQRHQWLMKKMMIKALS